MITTTTTITTTTFNFTFKWNLFLYFNINNIFFSNLIIIILIILTILKIIVFLILIILIIIQIILCLIQIMIFLIWILLITIKIILGPKSKPMSLGFWGRTHHDPLALGPEVRPKKIVSGRRPYYPWILMQDPTELSPDDGSIILGLSGRITFGSECEIQQPWVWTLEPWALGRRGRATLSNMGDTNFYCPNFFGFRRGCLTQVNKNNNKWFFS